MSIGNWTPEGESAKQALEINDEQLQQFIAFSERDELEALAELVDDQTQQVQSGLMRLGKEPWMQAAASLNEQEIIHLIRFFTKAESLLAGWEGGNESPVIWLAKGLRAQGGKLEKDLLLWIRNNSDNRFLPYGSVL
jgi:hypothetical protein